MKKVLLLLMMSLLIVPSLFAGAYVSGTVAPLSFNKAKLKIETEKTTIESLSISGNLGIQAGFLYEFSKNNEIGAEFGIGYVLSKQTQENTIAKNSELLLNIDLAYRHILSETLSVLGKVGFHGDFFDSDSMGMEINGYGINFNLGLLYALTKNVNFSFGVNLDTIFGGTIDISGIDLDGVNIKMNIVSFNPYIGIAYLF